METQISQLNTSDLSIGYLKKKQWKTIASGINFSIAKKELIGVIGINGVGKSTFLRTLSGAQDPVKGEVLLRDQNLHSITPEKLSSEIALVLTDRSFSRNLSVYELVSLGRFPYTRWTGKLSPKDLEVVDRVCKVVGIEDILHRSCYELSDGQLQKVLIARALAQETPMLILDEPTSHLDMYHKVQVLRLLKQLTQEMDKAIVFATHEINLAIQLCDKIMIVQPENSLLDTPEGLIISGAFDELFPDDFIRFEHRTKSFRIKS